MAAVGRLFRWVDQRWKPVGEPLPKFEHAPPDASRRLAPWILPRALEARVGDVVAWEEMAFRLLGRCADDSPEMQDLATQTLALHDAADVQRWMSEIELWLGMRAEPGRPWPLPPQPSP